MAICAWNSPVPGEFPAKGQWRGALMFSLICVWINDWVNNREAGDLRRYRAHYDVIVMDFIHGVQTLNELQGLDHVTGYQEGILSKCSQATCPIAVRVLLCILEKESTDYTQPSGLPLPHLKTEAEWLVIYRQVSNISRTLVDNKIFDSNYIFTLDLTPGFIGLGKDNCKTIRETFKFGDLVRLILQILLYLQTTSLPTEYNIRSAYFVPIFGK